MSRDPAYFRTISVKLSEVLDDIGVNEKTVLKKRRMILLSETIGKIELLLFDKCVTNYYFGSQSEGSTTIGLESDMDLVNCSHFVHVIKDWSEWQHGMINLLMIRDETTSPGYCLLQVLRKDEPLPLYLPEHLSESADIFRCYTVRGGRTLMKPASFNIDVDAFGVTNVKNGPANTVKLAGFTECDLVTAFPCKSWPVEAQAWLVRQGIGRWPTEEMKTYCEKTGCFVVPVSSKSSQCEDLEWRISTSMAERYLMFSLNITQIRCYILMKMILKVFINPQCNGVLSSFMCKTALLHCIQCTYSNSWQPPNLLACLTFCLIMLENFVRQMNCPHFIIPKNNLMAGRISPREKHKILEILQNFIQTEGRALLAIPIDKLGTRLQVKMNMYVAFNYYWSPALIYEINSGDFLMHVSTAINANHLLFLERITDERSGDVQEMLSDFTFKLMNAYREIGCNSLEKSALKLMIPLLYTSLGSAVASSEIYADGVISRKALTCFSIGLNSDVSSGRLKFASAMYCLGDMIKTEIVLRNTEGLYDLNIVEPVCKCFVSRTVPTRHGFKYKSSTGNEELLRRTIAFCIRFTRHEINCVPQELQYEMFRSTQEELFERNELCDFWMDWAVVDSLPYIYFLQYKTYGHLQRAAEQQQALTNLVATIEIESNLCHRETALNLLGQCMEQENRHNDALRCYMLSLNTRARNNAANFLVSRLFHAFARNRHVV
ncbi:uncharacterized protein LOC128552739 [Mercenaria mercenaria]|uniref:uncharacterized protein LOC128552739 n=1 Tax=Mercenaria mercenaria TaxID=6596 RepID=UPI00234ED74D|nr:uncharacterized protein LOC128552739 [Mercenaria mercenaria]